MPNYIELTEAGKVTTPIRLNIDQIITIRRSPQGGCYVAAALGFYEAREDYETVCQMIDLCWRTRSSDPLAAPPLANPNVVTLADLHSSKDATHD